MSRLEKTLGASASLVAALGAIGTLLGRTQITFVSVLVVIVVVMFFIAQVLRESRRQKRSIELLAESIRMTRSVASEAQREAIGARREVVAHSGKVRALLKDQFQMSFRRDKKLDASLNRALDELSRLGAGIDREGRSLRTVVRESTLESESKLREAEASITRQVDARSRQVRTQVVSERRNIIAGVVASEGRIGESVTSCASEIQNGQQIAGQRLTSHHDGLRDVMDAIEAVVIEQRNDLDQLRVRLNKVAENSAVEALGRAVTQLNDRSQSLNRDSEAFRASFYSTQQKLDAVYKDCASKLDGSMETIRKSLERLALGEDKSEIKEALSMISSDLDALERQATEGIEFLGTRQAKESNKLMVAMRSETQEVEALLQLFATFEPRWAMPSLGRWALDARSALHLRYLVSDSGPHRIVEFGGGSSTVWLAYLCEKMGARLVSVDHNPTFLERTRSMLERHGLSHVVETRLGVLEEYDLDGRTFSWYARSAYEDLSDVDMLFIDGPPSNTGPFARFPALPLLHDKLSASAVVLLDDCDRSDEKETVERWMSAYPEIARTQEGVSRLAVLISDRTLSTGSQEI